MSFKVRSTGHDEILLVLSTADAKVLKELAVFIEAKGVGATGEMLELCERMGPELERILEAKED